MKSDYLKRAMEYQDPRFAEILRKLGHESDEPVRTRDLKAEEPARKPAKKTTKKRTYKRRDMQAED